MKQRWSKDNSFEKRNIFRVIGKKEWRGKSCQKPIALLKSYVISINIPSEIAHNDIFEEALHCEIKESKLQFLGYVVLCIWSVGALFSLEH